MTLADRYRRWFEYEKDAHAWTLASLERVPDSFRGTPDYQKVLDLFAHILAARWIWLHRLGGSSEPPTAVFPGGASPAGLKEEAGRMHEAWSAFLNRLSDEDLERVIEYRSNQGAGPFRNSVADVLTQVYGHSLYHRGQIALLLRRNGAEPAATDFIFWARQKEPIAG